MRYEINFSKNLVFYRKKQNLTQQALADKIGYSAKSVSKWESAKGFPSIQTVIEISKILNVSLDELLLVKDERLFFLGIDGGGTKTQVLITDAKGSEIKKVLAEGCNPIDIGAENAKKILEKAIYEACEGIPFGNIVAFAGIAGGISGDMKKIFADFFKTFQFKRCC